MAHWENPPSEKFTPLTKGDFLDDHRECVRCGNWRKNENFHWDYRGGERKRQGTCKTCHAEAAKRKREVLRKNPHKAVSEKRCPRCEQTLPSSAFSLSRSQVSGLAGWCKACSGLYSKAGKFNLKVEAMRAYGGDCDCCGETGVDFLTLDHVDGNGKEHRKTKGVGTGQKFYAYLKLHGYPERIDGHELRILCFNCNYSAHLHGGVCLHEIGGVYA